MKIKNKKEYENACTKFESLKGYKKGTKQHKKRLELVNAIAEYENKLWNKAAKKW